MQLQQDMNMGDMKPEEAAKGGIMSIDEMIKPIGTT